MTQDFGDGSFHAWMVSKGFDTLDDALDVPADKLVYLDDPMAIMMDGEDVMTAERPDWFDEVLDFSDELYDEDDNPAALDVTGPGPVIATVNNEPTAGIMTRPAPFLRIIDGGKA